MIIGCWNVRGLNGLLTQNKVASLFQQLNMGIFGLLEMKITADKLQGYMKRNCDLLESRFSGLYPFAHHEPSNTLSD